METARTIWWRFTRRKGKLATFPGQWDSASSAGTIVAVRAIHARAGEANHLKVVIARAPQPGRLRSLWAHGSTWSRWPPHQFLDADQEFLMGGLGIYYGE